MPGQLFYLYIHLLIYVKVALDTCRILLTAKKWGGEVVLEQSDEGHVGCVQGILSVWCAERHGGDISGKMGWWIIE
jgi:hypothetical protein